MFNTQHVANVAKFITQNVTTHIGPPILYIGSSVQVAQPAAPLHRGKQGGEGRVGGWGEGGWREGQSPENN